MRAFPTFLLLGLMTNVSAAGAQTAFKWPNDARAAIVLTYDDAAASQLDIAVPQLDRARLHGTFFLTGRFMTAATVARWRKVGEAGHELGNHSINHPCARTRADQPAQYTSESYSVATMVAEIGVMDTLLAAIDGKRVHSYATPCGKRRVADGDYVEALRSAGTTRFVRASEPGTLDPRMIDPFDVPSTFFAEEASGADLIAYVERVSRAGGLGVMGFHGVGGDALIVSTQAHQQLIDFLAAHRTELWVATFSEVMQYVVSKSAPSKRETSSIGATDP